MQRTKINRIRKFVSSN